MPLHTEKHYKIWFSSNPKIGLPTENKLRLIRARLANPSLQFSLVYSSKLLDKPAHEDLLQFCSKLKFKTVDFDLNIRALLSHQYDETLYNIAQAELRHKLGNTGGNLAAASDCIRMLPGLIEQCGIYSDCDVEVNFEALLGKKIKLRSPVVLPCRLESDAEGIKVLNFNNDFIAAAFDLKKPSKLHPNALEKIREIQAEIIRRYTSPGEALLSPVLVGLPSSVQTSRTMRKIVGHFFKDPVQKSIFEFRKFIKEMTIESIDEILKGKKKTRDDQLAKVKDYLYKACVENISGPFVVMAVMRTELKECNLKLAFMNTNSKEYKLFDTCFDNIGTRGNGLATYVLDQDNPLSKAPSGDASWTAQGEENFVSRSAAIDTSVTIIQGAARAYIANLPKKSKEDASPKRLSAVLRNIQLN